MNYNTYWRDILQIFISFFSDDNAQINAQTKIEFLDEDRFLVAQQLRAEM